MAKTHQLIPAFSEHLSNNFIVSIEREECFETVREKFTVYTDTGETSWVFTFTTSQHQILKDLAWQFCNILWFFSCTSVTCVSQYGKALSNESIGESEFQSRDPRQQVSWRVRRVRRVRRVHTSAPWHPAKWINNFNAYKVWINLICLNSYPTDLD